MSRGQLLRNGLRQAESFDVLPLRYLRTEPGGGRSPLPTQEGWLFTRTVASLLEDSLFVLTLRCLRTIPPEAKLFWRYHCVT